MTKIIKNTFEQLLYQYINYYLTTKNGKMIKTKKECQTVEFINYKLLENQHKLENKYHHNHNMNNNTYIEDTSNDSMISSTLVNADENIRKHIISLLKKNSIRDQNIF